MKNDNYKKNYHGDNHVEYIKNHDNGHDNNIIYDSRFMILRRK